jgi:hypothetical protein
MRNRKEIAEGVNTTSSMDWERMLLRVLHHPKDAVPQNTKPGRSRNRKQGRADDEGKVIPVHSRPYLQANAFQTISASKCPHLPELSPPLKRYILW